MTGVWRPTLLAIVSASLPVPASAHAAQPSTASTTATSASSADRYEGEWAYRVRPWQRQPVVAVTVEASGLGESARSAGAEPEACTTFRPGERQIRVYVARAEHVSLHAFVHESTWSACFATGKLRFRDGVVADWMVQRAGAGYFAIAGVRYYFDCPDCALGNAAAGAKR